MSEKSLTISCCRTHLRCAPVRRKAKRYVGEMIVRILMLLILISATSAAAEDFTGSWSIVYPQNGIEQHDDYFELYLIQQGNEICGLHFGSARGSAKIDSSFGSEPSPTVSGEVEKNMARIEINSSQSVAPIDGVFVHHGVFGSWRVNDPGKDRPITIPASAELKSVPPVDLGSIDLKELCAQ
ncbi:hypothetical protein ACQUWM_15305 [Marinobacter sp. DUT-3]|uniref:hypothetical protein n=1 Tax=Marinobacter sp. DUT-3 TaxID=3412036 RepID=UPI003D17A829